MLGEARCEYMDVRARRQIIRLVEHPGQGNRAPRITHGFAHVSRNMDEGMETFIQPCRKLLRRAEDALMKSTGPGFRQIPFASVGESEALEALETQAEVDEDIGKSRPDLAQWRSRSCHDSCKSVFPLQQSPHFTQRSFFHQIDLSKNQRIVGDEDHTQEEYEKETKTNRTLLQGLSAVEKNTGR